MNPESLFVIDLPKKILTEEEHLNYLKEYQNGIKEAKEIIIIHGINYVIYIVERIIKKLPENIYDKKDLVAVGIIGLIKSIDTFDFKKKKPFELYSYVCINNQIQLFLKKERKHTIRNISSETILKQHENGKELCIKDILYSNKYNPEVIHQNYEVKKTLSKIINNLPDTNKKIAILYFGFYKNRPHTQQEIADIFGFSQSYASRLIKKTIEMIKEELINLDIIEQPRKDQKIRLRKATKGIKNNT